MKKITPLIFMFSVFLLSAQDNCGAAIPANVGSTTTVGAINGTTPTLICDQVIGGGVGDTAENNFADHGEWYTYEAGVNGYAVITTELVQNSGGDTNMYVYSGTCGALNCIANSDDINSDVFLSEVIIKVSSGTTYYIAFDNRWDSSGFDLLITETALSCTNEVLPYNEEFDDTGVVVACWDFIDDDADGRNWFIEDYNLDGLGGPDGEPTLTSRSFYLGAGSLPYVLTPDNWAISKGIVLPPNLDFELTWKVRGFALAFSHENYTVYVATGNTITDFENSAVFLNEFADDAGGSGVYADRSLDISDLAGNTVYIAFRHHDVTNQSELNIDAIGIIEGTLSIPDVEINKLKHYYNFSSKSLTLKVTNNTLTNLRLFNMLGQEVLKTQLSNSNKEVINLSTINDGIYIAKASLRNGSTSTFKFLKH